MLRGAMIGLGNIAVRGHVPAYRTDEFLKSKIQIVAVMDVVEQNREKAKEHLPGAKFYTDIESLLAQEQLDFVDICTPPHTHAEYIQACIAKGIHIICEKPLTENYSSTGALVRKVQEAKVVFVPCHQYKYSPLWKTIHDIIKAKALGEVTLAQFNVFRLHADSGTAAWNPEWRTNKKQSGGGILVDTGAHYFYLAQYFFGIPKKVSSLLRTLKHSDYTVEDTAVVTLDYGGRLMQCNLTWAANHRANSAFIVGTEGTLTYDGTTLLQESTSGIKEIPMPDVSDKKQYIAWYASLFKEFVARVEGKNTSTDLLEEAAMVMKLLDLSYRGSEQHAILDVA
jgi:predicted dehydrogenase